MRYSVVLISWNRREQVLETLGRLMEVVTKDDEVILVDNGSTDGTCKAVRESFPCVRVIPMDRNLGVAAYNSGFAAATGKYIVILDDDSFPQEDSLDIAYEFLEKESEVGAIAGNIIGKDGENQTRKFFPGSFPSQPVPIAAFVGCGAIFRRTVLNVLKGYCADYFLYWNEDEIALRLWNLGYRLIFHPEVKFTHFLSKRNRTSRRTMYYSIRNGLWFIRTVSLGYDGINYMAGLLLSWILATIRHPSLVGTYFRAVFEGLSRPVPKIESSPSVQHIFGEYLRSIYSLRVVVSRVILRRLTVGRVG